MGDGSFQTQLKKMGLLESFGHFLELTFHLT